MICFLGGFFPENLQSDIIKHSKGNVQFAADALQKSIVRGLIANHVDFCVLNSVYIGSYPLLYTKLKIYGSEVYLDGNSIGTNLPFCNLLIYKNISRFYYVYKALIHLLQKKEPITIIVYAMHLPFLLALKTAKKRYGKKIKVCLVVPDLPEFMNERNSIFHKININLIYKQLDIIDGYVVLTKPMMSKLSSNKPYLVMEGIYSEKDIYLPKKNSTEKVILYSGTLAKRYGILNLLNAFMMINNPMARLVICGDGDTKKDILLAASSDKRILYKGLLPREEILLLQKQATLLVNPRGPEGEFTSYSFPSKTMEYFASGTPVLMYRLKGVPDEYWDYCFTIDDVGVGALATKMNQILKMNPNDLCNIGQSARNFILQKKNEKKQGERILNFIQNI